MRYAVIMAGGSGLRLWPLSRMSRPKQLIKLVDGRSLLQLTWDRIVGLLPAEQIFVCTAESDAGAVLAELPQLPADNLLCEPVGRDTANAIGFASAVLCERDPDAVIAFLTADHIIEPATEFRAALDRGFALAARPDRLVTFGIVPTHAHTGLGYVETGGPLPDDTAGREVVAFREKPDVGTAQTYLESGRHLWNSGMFVWRADSVLDRLAAHLPAAHADLTRIAKAWGTDQRTTTLESLYPTLPKISIDYAVMEPASRDPGVVVVVPMDVSWLDVGSWPTLARTLPLDKDGNAVSAKLSTLDAGNNVVVSADPDHLVAAIGVTDLIVIHTDDVTLVCRREDAERVKAMAEQVAERFRRRYS
jgi:mannose-1-phosphate guanylyltransferase